MRLSARWAMDSCNEGARILSAVPTSYQLGRLLHAGAPEGADNVARVLASIFPLLVRTNVTVEPREVNGQPGAILRDRDGNVAGALTLDVLAGRIQTIRSVVNPDKLGHLGPVADAWAVAREVKQARRPND